MGIPKFFRWLSGRYPLVCERISDDNIPEFDNLYLDMNGIIHNCTHPKDGEAPAPATDEERFLAIFYYIDFLFNKIRPQKVFFLGIDGVAPRAKMNEQRARRFRTAQELAEQHNKDLAERRANGEVIRAEDEESSEGMFDPTCITPGTEFMDKLTEALRYYINKRVSEDANWRKPQIILSAPNVPGEGEHKIMDYIRFSRAQPGYNPNVRHCLYGLDADLIMLGLLSHEPHFSLLREEVLFGGRGQKSGAAADPSMQAFYLLHISILRDYLDHEFSGLKSKLGCSAQYAAMERDGIAAEAGEATAQNEDSNAFDLERIIDDYILMIMLVGNDFLPNLPKLSINGGALNFMFATYTRIRPSLGGYLHDNGILNLERLEVFMREIAKFEVDSFKLEVGSHQWYQVYKHKAKLRGETPEESSVVEDHGRGGGKNRRRGLGAHHHRDNRQDDSNGLSEMDYSSVMGEAATPIKGNRLVISKSQQGMLELIRRFVQRELPKVAAARHKVPMQFLPGPATELDNLIVKRAAELLGIHVGHEYAHDGALTLYVAMGSAKAIAKLELEDTSSSSAEDGESRVSSGAINFVSSGSTAFQALGGLEDVYDDDDSDDVDVEGKAAAAAATEQLVPAVAAFVESGKDIHDSAAVAEYVAMRLRPLDDVLVVADSELALYTQTGDVSDFWQRFELWKAAYYGAKLDIVYDAPDCASEAEGDSGGGSSNSTASGQRFRRPAATVEPMCRSYIGSLQWVLQYYYRGCQSWSWYYPYHYAPCISDMCANLAAYRVAGFAADEPYTPYEQLMCVLPPFSRKLLPAGLRALMVDAHSPIRDMYPTSFSVDMNGKKMAWEAVVLIDFVDAGRIRAAMQPALQQLSDDERRRNSRGTNMAYSYAPLSAHDDDNDDANGGAPVYRAPVNLRFPAIRPLRCKGMVYTMPSLRTGGPDQRRLISGLIGGAATRGRMLSGFPSLFTAAHHAQLALNGTEVFGFPSRDESMQIALEDGAAALALDGAERLAGELLCGRRRRGVGYQPRRVFVAWPYMRDAALVGVSDASGTYTMDAAGGGVIFLEHPGAGERQAWTRRYMDAVHRAKKTQAVLTPERARVLVHVLPLRGMELLADGSLVRDYGFSSTCSPLNTGGGGPPPGGEPQQPWAPPALWGAAGVAAYPAGLVSTDARGAWADSPRFRELDAAPLDQALAVGSRAFFLGRSALYGAAGRVVGHAYDGAGVAVGVDLQVAVAAGSSGDRARHDNFLAVQALARADTEHYAPSYAVARTVGVSPLLLSRITSKLLLLGDDSKHVHVGLDLKSEARRLKVAGFTRRGPSGWQFSERAVALVAQYKQAFPRMFAALERAAKAGSASAAAALPTAAECFRPEQPGVDARAHVAAEVRRVRQWLRDNADRGALALVPIESELLSRAQIAAIVAARAATTTTTANTATSTTTVRGVRREAALRPADAEHVLKAQALAVGHRVAYVADRGGSVPLGATGYVVGIHAKEDAGGGGATPASASASPAANSQYAARLRQEGVPADAIAAVEVLLDRPFADGTTLDGRCPPQRGALVRPHQLLDLTSCALAVSAHVPARASNVVVDAIAPAPDTLAPSRSRSRATAGQTADVAAKARVLLSRPAHAHAHAHAEGGGVSVSVSVPEPRRAPWAANSASASASDSADHASRIMGQLLGRPAAAKPTTAKPATAKPVAKPTTAKPSADDQHAQSIINTLLAGPMERLSVAPSQKCPLVIEDDEYLSDSADEDATATTNANTNANANAGRFYYNYANDRPPVFGRGGSQSRGGSHPRGGSYPRGGGSYPRGGGSYPRGGGSYPRGGGSYPRGGGSYPRGGGSQHQAGSHPQYGSHPQAGSQHHVQKDGPNAWRGRGRGRGSKNPLNDNDGA